MGNIKSYKELLDKVTRQHEKTIAESKAQIEALIAETERDLASSLGDAQSIWVDGEDNERFLMLNESAVRAITEVFEQFQDVIALLTKKGSHE